MYVLKRLPLTDLITNTAPPWHIEHKQETARQHKPKHRQLSMADAREVLKAQISQNWRALRDASEEMKGDRQVVMTAVSLTDGNALQYATEEMKGDPAR